MSKGESIYVCYWNSSYYNGVTVEVTILKENGLNSHSLYFQHFYNIYTKGGNIMSNSINTLLRNKANNKIYYPITKGENIIQDKDHRLVTDEQTTSWDKLKETKYDKTGGLISGDVSISTGKLYMNDGDNTYMALSLVNSTVELGNSSINTSILGSGDLKYNGYKVLTTNNYTDCIGDTYIKSSGGIISGTIKGENIGPVIRTVYNGPYNYGEIIIGNYDTANSPSLTLAGSSVNAKDLSISGHLYLDDNAYISSNSDNVSILKYNSGVLYVGASNKKLQLNCTEASVNGETILTEDNYTDCIGDTYIKSSGNDNGKPMSGSFYVDNGYMLIAPEYDNANNRVENTNNTLIDVHYNYNSNYTASRYPNSLTIGDSNLDLYMHGKSITSLGKLNHRGDIEVDGDLYLTNSDKKLYTKTPNGNKVCLLQTVMNSSTQEIRFGNADSLLRITGKGDPTYADSEKSTVYNLLHTGNISKCGIKDGIALLHENTPSIYTVDHEGTKQITILSYDTNTNVLKLGNYMASVKVGGDRVITENDLSEYLPLSGGTISGDLLMDDGSRILINPNSHIELNESGVGSILSFSGDYISFGSPRKYLSINCLNASINGDRILLQHNIENYVPMFKLLFSGYVGSTGISYSKVNVNNCATSVEGYEEGKKLLKFTAPSTGNYLFIVRCTGANGTSQNGVDKYDIDVGEYSYSTTRVCTNINETGATVYDIAKDGSKYVCVWNSSYKTYVYAEVSIIKLA